MEKLTPEQKIIVAISTIHLGNALLKCTGSVLSNSHHEPLRQIGLTLEGISDALYFIPLFLTIARLGLIAKTGIDHSKIYKTFPMGVRKKEVALLISEIASCTVNTITRITL